MRNCEAKLRAWQLVWTVESGDAPNGEVIGVGSLVIRRTVGVRKHLPDEHTGLFGPGGMGGPIFVETR